MRTQARWVSVLVVVQLLACDEPRLQGSPVPCVPSGDDRVVCSRIHPPGILDPDSPDHHGALLRASNYDFAECARCHGRDFAGGGSKASCLGCHVGGPTACTTCHAEIATQGAHAVHLAGATVAQPEACAECHVVPRGWDTIGHIFAARGRLDAPPAEVRLGPLAARGAPADALPVYDAAARTCSNVTCHGGLIGAVGAADPLPRWDAPHRDLGCMRCHGFPPPTPSHADDACEHCHPRVATGDGVLVDARLHIDTRIDLGADGSGDCESCHPRVGDDPMHGAHLRPTLRLAGAVGCEGCHLVPRTATSAGHLDTLPPAEVFPPGHGGVAWTRGAMPVWDHDAQTCAGTWCHGVRTTIAWRRFPTQIVCGSCHGIPPTDANHQADWTVRDCARCHDTVDRFGNPQLVETSTGVRSRHLDGKVDVR